MQSLLRLRGILLNPENRCPACGEETLRRRMPSLLLPLRRVLGERVTYRQCEGCRRDWVAFHTRRHTPALSDQRVRLADAASAVLESRGLGSVRIEPLASPSDWWERAAEPAEVEILVPAPESPHRGEPGEVLEAQLVPPAPQALELLPLRDEAETPELAGAMRQRIGRMIDRVEAGEIEEVRRELNAERWLAGLDWSGVPRQLQAETRASFVEVLVALVQDPPDRELALWYLWIAHARFEGEEPKVE